MRVEFERVSSFHKRMCNYWRTCFYERHVLPCNSFVNLMMLSHCNDDLFAIQDEMAWAGEAARSSRPFNELYQEYQRDKKRRQFRQGVWNALARLLIYVASRPLTEVEGLPTAPRVLLEWVCHSPDALDLYDERHYSPMTMVPCECWVDLLLYLYRQYVPQVLDYVGSVQGPKGVQAPVKKQEEHHEVVSPMMDEEEEEEEQEEGSDHGLLVENRGGEGEKNESGTDQGLSHQHDKERVLFAVLLAAWQFLVDEVAAGTHHSAIRVNVLLDPSGVKGAEPHSVDLLLHSGGVRPPCRDCFALFVLMAAPHVYLEGPASEALCHVLVPTVQKPPIRSRSIFQSALWFVDPVKKESLGYFRWGSEVLRIAQWAPQNAAIDYLQKDLVLTLGRLFHVDQAFCSFAGSQAANGLGDEKAEEDLAEEEEVEAGNELENEAGSEAGSKAKGKNRRPIQKLYGVARLADLGLLVPTITGLRVTLLMEAYLCANTLTWSTLANEKIYWVIRLMWDDVSQHGSTQPAFTSECTMHSVLEGLLRRSWDPALILMLAAVNHSPTVNAYLQLVEFLDRYLVAFYLLASPRMERPLLCLRPSRLCVGDRAQRARRFFRIFFALPYDLAYDMARRILPAHLIQTFSTSLRLLRDAYLKEERPVDGSVQEEHLKNFLLKHPEIYPQTRHRHFYAPVLQAQPPTEEDVLQRILCDWQCYWEAYPPT
jgi:hypothetical protein